MFLAARKHLFIGKPCARPRKKGGSWSQALKVKNIDRVIVYHIISREDIDIERLRTSYQKYQVHRISNKKYHVNRISYQSYPFNTILFFTILPYIVDIKNIEKIILLDMDRFHPV